MASRIPAWVKVTGAMVAAGSMLAMVVIPSKRFKDWFIGQWGFPHGPVGWVTARWMEYLNLHSDDGFSTAAALLRLEPEDRLVQIACATGAFLDRFAPHVSHVAGLDAADINVQLARRRLAERIADGSAEIIQGDAAALPWDNNTFTAATCLGFLTWHAPDPEGTLVEMYRVLQPGGRLVIDFGIDESDEACVKECDWWGLPHPPEEEVRKMVEGAGFSLVSISYLHHGYLARFIEGIKPE